MVPLLFFVFVFEIDDTFNNNNNNNNNRVRSLPSFFKSVKECGCVYFLKYFSFKNTSKLLFLFFKIIFDISTLKLFENTKKILI